MQWHLIFSYRTPQKDKLWDSFQDPPPPQTGGSAVDTKRFESLKQILKLLTFIIVFIVILCAGVLAKSTFLLMATYTRNDSRIRYCNIRCKKIQKETFCVSWDVNLKYWYSSLSRIVRYHTTRTKDRLDMGTRICIFSTRIRYDFPSCTNLFLSKFRQTNNISIFFGLVVRNVSRYWTGRVRFYHLTGHWCGKGNNARELCVPDSGNIEWVVK